MKLLAIDWQVFLQALEHYRRLPYGARKAFVEKVPPTQPVPGSLLGEWLEGLVASGLVVAGPQGKNFRTDAKYQGVSRALRALHRSRVFHAPSRESFQAFVLENFDGPEIASFCGPGREYYYYRDYAAVQAVYSRVCAAEWLKGFLAAEDSNWEIPYQAAGSTAYFSSEPVLRAVQALIRILIPGAAPVPIAQIPGMCPDVRPDVLAAAIHAGLRYLLVFPCLLHESLEPALGLWPTAARKLSSEIPRPPEPVTVSQPFHSPFLVDDMTSVLAACAVVPPRTRVSDSRIFEADQRALVASLGTLPQWIEQEFRVVTEKRISAALDFLRYGEFLEERGRGAREARLEVTPKGSHWLGLSEKDRLKSVLDRLRRQTKEQQPHIGHDVGLLPQHVNPNLTRHLKVIASALAATFAQLPADEFLRRSEFLAYQKEAQNPLASILREEPYFAVTISGRSVGHPSADELEQAWEEILSAFLRLRLLPLGGVRVGIDGKRAVCFAITDAGRYLLGAVDDFHVAVESSGGIVLQPNCEVVFLTPAARAEAEIARFCERLGRHIGTLFKVTKKSILEAAASGLTAERVLATLREYCGAELPGNVEREILGWFGQYRPVRIVRATLVHCPDRDTATRVMAAVGSRATRLNDTTIEWHEEKPAPSLLKKLRDMGIFLR